MIEPLQLWLLGTRLVQGENSGKHGYYWLPKKAFPTIDASFNSDVENISELWRWAS